MTDRIWDKTLVRQPLLYISFMDDTISTIPVSVIFVWETKEANVAIVRVVVAGNCSAHAPAAMPWTKPSDHLGRVRNARGKYSRDSLWHK